jgi:hypothetical protein
MADFRNNAGIYVDSAQKADGLIRDKGGPARLASHNLPPM